MGLLIELPIRDTVSQESETWAPEGQKSASFGNVDFSIWKNAPKERTAAYFPTYSMISKAMQTAMRSWVREWFNANPEVLLRPHTAYPVLVFQCTHPFAGKATNVFTYDIQQTEALNRAFTSAASKLGRELKTLDTKKYAWLTREHYFAYRSKEVVKYVMKNRRTIYRMLNVETMLMDSILKFAIIDVPKLGPDEALVILRRSFTTQLRRFSDEFDLSVRTEELLAIATAALVGQPVPENTVDTEKANAKVLEMPRKMAYALEMPLAA
ncbi:MAG: hypothetical protein ACJ746_12000 [Bryobacteraceae bacterium]